jgi:putative acetyltransferase
MLIREERAADDWAINDLTIRAFKPMSYSDGSEAPIIRALRQSGHLTLSLVAEEEAKIVGHVAFSPIAIDGIQDGWFGLGPIAVEPARQRSGIGRALIHEGLQRLKERNALGVALIGDPAFYGRVGFESDGLLSYKDVDRAYVLRIVFSGPVPHGEIRYADAFERGNSSKA